MEIDNHEAWVDSQVAKLDSPSAWQPEHGTAWARLQQRRAGLRLQKQRRLIVAGGIAIAGAGLVAFPTTRAFAEHCVDACVAQTQNLFTGQRHPAVSKASAAPDFQLIDASGSTVRLSDFKGKVVLLNFWATWCQPCVTEMPWFVDLQRTYKDQGLVVLGVSMDDEGWTAVRPFVEKQQLNYRVMVGSDDVARLYGGVEALPTTFLIRRDGTIAGTHTGLVTKETYDNELQSLLKVAGE